MNTYHRTKLTDGNKKHLSRVTRPLAASAEPAATLVAMKDALLEAIAGPQPKSVRRRK